MQIFFYGITHLKYKSRNLDFLFQLLTHVLLESGAPYSQHRLTCAQLSCYLWQTAFEIAQKIMSQVKARISIKKLVLFSMHYLLRFGVKNRFVDAINSDNL